MQGKRFPFTSYHLTIVLWFVMNCQSDRKFEYDHKNILDTNFTLRKSVGVLPGSLLHSNYLWLLKFKVDWPSSCWQLERNWCRVRNDTKEQVQWAMKNIQVVCESQINIRHLMWNMIYDESFVNPYSTSWQGNLEPHRKANYMQQILSLGLPLIDQCYINNKHFNFA